MSTIPAFDSAAYGSLFAASLLKEITSNEENDARIEELEAYSVADELSPEQEAYAKVLTILIEAYEERFDLPRTIQPVEAIKVLMSDRELKQVDLVPVIGNKSHVSEILSGKRDLSKSHIQKLSEFFRVPPEVFFPLPRDA